MENNMPQEPYSNPNNRPPVAVVTAQGRIVAIFARATNAVAFMRGLPWGREVHLMDPADAVQRLLLEQAEEEA